MWILDMRKWHFISHCQAAFIGVSRDQFHLSIINALFIITALLQRRRQPVSSVISANIIPLELYFRIITLINVGNGLLCEKENS